MKEHETSLVSRALPCEYQSFRQQSQNYVPKRGILLLNTSYRRHTTPDPVLYSFDTTSEVSEALTQFILTAQDESLAKKDSFKVAISGGSLPVTLGEKLVGRDGVKWEQWEVFFADERVVPLDHEDSNYRLNKKEIFDKVPIPHERIHPINVELLDDLEELADDYEQQIMSSFAGKNSVLRPRFDLVLLGMGPDGGCDLVVDHDVIKC